MASRRNRRGVVTKRFVVQDRDALPDALGEALDTAGFTIEGGGLRADGSEFRATKRTWIPELLLAIVPLDWLGLGTDLRLDARVQPSLNEGDDRLFCELRIRPFYGEGGTLGEGGALGDDGGILEDTLEVGLGAPMEPDNPNR